MANRFQQLKTDVAENWCFNIFAGVFDPGNGRIGPGRGNFAVLGHKKSSFSGVLICPKLLFCFTPIARNFEIYAAHRRSLLQQAVQQKTPRAQQYTRIF